MSGGPAYPLQLPVPSPPSSLFSDRLGMKLDRAISLCFLLLFGLLPSLPPPSKVKSAEICVLASVFVFGLSGGELEKALPVWRGRGGRGGGGGGGLKTRYKKFT